MAEKMILRFPVQPAKRDEFIKMLIGVLPDTLAYEGCLSAVTYTPENSDGDVWVLEEWETRANQAAYFAWRVETGLVDAIGPFMAGAPETIWLTEHT